MAHKIVVHPPTVTSLINDAINAIRLAQIANLESEPTASPDLIINFVATKLADVRSLLDETKQEIERHINSRVRPEARASTARELLEATTGVNPERPAPAAKNGYYVATASRGKQLSDCGHNHPTIHATVPCTRQMIAEVNSLVTLVIIKRRDGERLTDAEVKIVESL